MSAPVNKQDGTEVIYNIPGVGVMTAFGATIPTDGGSGYAPCCTYHTTTTTKLYVNTGTLASATWTIVGTQS